MIVFAGQSNAEMMRGEHIAYFKSAYQVLGGGNVDVSVAAWGGSAALKSNASSSTPLNFWVMRSDSLHKQYLDGPRLTQALNDLILLPPVDLLVWMQGEQDATRVKTTEEKLEYRAATAYIFSRLKGIGIKRFAICPTGRRLNSNKEDGIQLIRQAQRELVTDRSDTVIASDTYDLPMQDHVHYSDDGRKLLLDRVAKTAVRSALGHDGTPCPSIRYVNVNANDKTKLMVELTGVDSLSLGSNSRQLFSANFGHRRIECVGLYKISETLIEVTLASNATTKFELHVGNSKLIGIEKNKANKILNEYGLPLCSGIFPIEPARWG